MDTEERNTFMEYTIDHRCFRRVLRRERPGAPWVLSDGDGRRIRTFETGIGDAMQWIHEEMLEM